MPRSVWLAVLFWLLLGAEARGSEPCVVETIAGGRETNFSGDGGPASEAQLLRPNDIAYDSNGALWIADTGNGRLRRVDPAGVIDTVMTGLAAPSSFAFDDQGGVFVLERDGARIMHRDAAGELRVVAGTGQAGFSGDGGPGAAAKISGSGRIAWSPDGLLVADSANQRVRRIRDGRIETIAGAEQGLIEPADVLPLPDGAVLVADPGAFRIWRIAADGSVAAEVGNGDSRGPTSQNNAPPAEWAVGPVRELALDPEGGLVFRTNGNLFSSSQAEIRTVLPLQRTDPAGPTLWLIQAFVLAPDESWSVVLDHRVMRGSEDTRGTLLAGQGSSGPHGDGGLAQDAYLASPADLEYDADGNLIFIDPDLNRVRRILADGRIEGFAGNGLPTGLGDGGPATAAGLIHPADLAVSPSGEVAVTVWQKVRVVSIDGTIRTLAGDGNISCCRASDRGMPADQVPLSFPDRIAADRVGGFFVSLTRPSGWVRYTTPDGLIQDVLDRNDRRIPFALLRDLTVDPQGRLVARTSQGIVRIAPDGSADDWPELSGLTARLLGSGDDAFDEEGNFYFSEGPRIRRFTTDGVLQTIAGSPLHETGYAGDGGPADEALFGADLRLAVSEAGDLAIADRDNRRIRVISDVAGCPVVRRPTVASLTEGAAFRLPPSPGAIFAMFGVGLGPDELAAAELDAAGRLPTELAGVQVLFNGSPAPLLFVQHGQIGGITPQKGAESQLVAEVIVSSVRSEPSLHTALDLSPALFTLDSSGGGPAAALNQDGSLNSAENPAEPGSIVVLYGTGFGPLDREVPDGAVATDLARTVITPTAAVGPVLAETLYSGSAVGLVHGAVQLNIRLGMDTPSGGQPVVFSAAKSQSQPSVTIWVR